jgi:hypothetical protein
MLGNRRNRLLRSCGNANSSFEESKPASHPFLGERIPRYVPPPTGVEPACVLVEVTDLFTTSLTFPPPREGQVVSQIKLPGERPSRTLILREDASCLVSTLWSRQPKYPNSSPPGIGRPGSCCPRDRAMMDVLEKLPGEQTKSGPPYGGGSVSAKYPKSSPPGIRSRKSADENISRGTARRAPLLWDEVTDPLHHLEHGAARCAANQIAKRILSRRSNLAPP